MAGSLFNLAWEARCFPRIDWEATGVEYRFKVDEWQNMTPAERTRRCRLMAEEARALATGASGDLRRRYLGIAEEWLQLAIEIEYVAAQTRSH